jgi:hypothetical protein
MISFFNLYHAFIFLFFNNTKFEIKILKIKLLDVIYIIFTIITVNLYGPMS